MRNLQRKLSGIYLSPWRVNEGTEALPIVTELRAKLARYEQAEKEGRLVIAPDKLYDLIFDECSSKESYITEYPTEGVYIGFAGDYLSPDEIGKTVFLSREDAEAALKERRGTNYAK